MRLKAITFSFILAFFSFSVLHSQTLLVDTAFTTDPGLGGAPASCIFTGGTLYGHTASISVGYSIADDFTVPSGQTWRLDSVRVFGYQTGSTTTSTLNAARIRIWNGRPDSAGAMIIFGDSSGTAMVGTGWTGVYRVSSTTLTNTQRPIMFATLNCGGTIVTQGVYWIEYTLGGTLASGPFTPPKVLPGRLNPPGQNSRQRTFATNSWAAALDGSTPVGYGFIIRGQNLTAISGNSNEIPVKYALKQNYPNPFNPVTTIEFDIPNSGYTRLTVYNSLGQLVATLLDEELAAGSHSIQFNAVDLPSGFYVYKLESKEFVDTKKMTLVK
jgi:hypothetical protein